MKKLPQGEELIRECTKRGISVDPISSVFSSFVDNSDKELMMTNKTEGELQYRLLEFKRARREARLWIIALVSSIAAVLSAGAAILAVAVGSR